MLSNSDSTIADPYFSLSSKSPFLYRASLHLYDVSYASVFPSRFVSRLFDCRFVCRIVCRFVECQIGFCRSMFVSVLFVGIVLVAVMNECRRFSN